MFGKFALPLIILNTSNISFPWSLSMSSITTTTGRNNLERDEVFEVLRLIRNTADLSNVIYMVAYDKEYVTCVLEEKNIKDSSAYLEKIFPLEIHLPKVDEDMIWKVLYTEIDAQKSSLGKGYADVLFSKFGSFNNFKICVFLTWPIPFILSNCEENKFFE